MLCAQDAIPIFGYIHKTMKYKVSDFVVYKTDKLGEVFTWIKHVYEDEGYYILHYGDIQVREDEIRGYTATNFTVPPANGNLEIDRYHRDTMIDRIVTVLQALDRPSILNVSKSAGVILFDTVITDADLILDQEKLQQFVDKFNRIIARVQEKFDGRWNTEIPVVLRFPLKWIELDSITI